MPSRSAGEIREEIAAERRRLDDDLTNLERELLSGVPLLAGGVLLAAAILIRRRRRKPRNVTLTWKLR
jgi:hypothetical protein